MCAAPLVASGVPEKTARRRLSASCGSGLGQALPIAAAPMISKPVQLSLLG
jgi:hypothetical protein